MRTTDLHTPSTAKMDSFNFILPRRLWNPYEWMRVVGWPGTQYDAQQELWDRHVRMVKTVPTPDSKPDADEIVPSGNVDEQPDSSKSNVLEENNLFEEPAQDSIPSNPADQQLVRNQCYVVFRGEDETDYTEGPVRLINATDGIKECTALLMRLELSGKIQNSIQAQHHFAKSRRIATQQRDVMLNYEIELDAEISDHKFRLSEAADAENEAEHAKIEQELEYLEMMVQDAKARREEIEANIQTEKDLLLEHQAEVNADLEEAFIVGNLLAPEEEQQDPPVEELNVQNEYQLFRKRLAEYGNTDDYDDSIAPLGTVEENYKAPELSEEEKAQETLKENYWDAYQRLREAQHAFDCKERDRAIQLQANYDASARGMPTTDPSEDAFDLRWLKRFQELTHELLEAEVALSDAKAAARDADVDIPVLNDQASGFRDDVDDGYRLSFEQDCVDSAPRQKVDGWLEAVDRAEAGSPSFNDGSECSDEWEADEVQVSDSVSVVAEGTERRRIDKWRKTCGR